MEGLLARLYRRMGRGYLSLPVSFAFVSTEINAVLIVLIGTIGYLQLPDHQVRYILALGLGGGALGLVLAFSLIPFLFKNVLRWMGGDKDRAAAPLVWREITSMGMRIGPLGGASVALVTLPAGVSASRYAELPAFGVILSTIAVLFAIAANVVLNLVVVEIWSRPIVREVAAHLPRGFRPNHRRLPLTAKMVPAIVLIAFVSAFFTLGLVGQVEGVEQRVLRSMAAGAVMAVLALAFALTIARSVVGPAKELLAAARSVREGDLGVSVAALSHDEIGELTLAFNDMVTGLSERAALHSALGAYVEPTIADRLLSEGEVLSGEELDVTVMFVDIVAFTARAEQMRPDAVVSELNEFFSIVIPLVRSHGGHANKLLGDGLMAVFGAPDPLDRHADAAVRCAIEIQRALHDRYGRSLRAGVGINSGSVVVGTTGGGPKLDYTVIGDAVNVASRIEALTRETGDEILISDSTREQLDPQGLAIVPRGSTPIKGRVAPVQIHAVHTRPA